jgi:CubicO group peptidase (beta-lactamase class C family)
MAVHVSRRRFCELAGLSTASLILDGRNAVADPDLNQSVTKLLGADYRPGLAACRVEGERVTWSAGFGWSDLENKIAMTPGSILNIASVSKTFTASAVMQLWEAGKIDLDGSVDAYLPFSVRNPQYPDTVITCRQLLTHRSSINDGPEYARSYTCGDPTISLEDWCRGFLEPGGLFYSKEHNFHDWKPGTKDPPESPGPYSNVGYGLLALVVERIAKAPFFRFTAERIFQPLGMSNTAWYISEIDTKRHAVPYTRIGEDFEFPPEYPDPGSYLPRFEDPGAVAPGDLFPHCLYSFPNYPDGLVRSSVSDLSKFLLAMANAGSLGDSRILEETTIKSMLTDTHFGRGLCWSSTTLKGRSQPIWYHGGSDPGVSTFLGFRPHDRVGVIVIANCGDPGPGFSEIVRTLFLGHV